MIGISAVGFFWLCILAGGAKSQRSATASWRQDICEWGFIPVCALCCLLAAALDLAAITINKQYLPMFGTTCHGTDAFPVDLGNASFWDVADFWFAHGASEPVSQMNVTLMAGSPKPFHDKLSCFHFLSEYRAQIIARYV